MPEKQWSAGDVLTAADMNVWAVPVTVIKPSDTLRNTLIVPAADPDLVVPVAASSSYWVHGLIIYTGLASAPGDIQWTWTVPASTTGQVAITHLNISGAFAGAFVSNWTDSGGAAQQAQTQGGTVPLQLGVDGILVVAGTAGNLTFKWSQNTSAAGNTTVKAQSYLAAQRIN